MPEWDEPERWNPRWAEYEDEIEARRMRAIAAKRTRQLLADLQRRIEELEKEKARQAVTAA
mgnify:CR=1 FL=1